WVVAGLALLAVGLTVAWQRSETFRRVVTGAWDAVAGAAGKAKDFFDREVWPVIRDGWSEISEAASPVVEKLSGFFSRLRESASGFSEVWGPIWEGATEKVSIFWAGL